MNSMLIMDVSTMQPSCVKVRGWIQSVRELKHLYFLVLRDRTGTVQLVHEKRADPALSARIAALTQESVVEVTGELTINEAVRSGGREIRISSIEVLSAAQSPYPFDGSQSAEARLDWRFLDLREPRNNLLFRVQTTAEHAMRSFWMESGFIEMHSPKLMGSASESGAELFRVEYFDSYAYLAQSPQFYKQMAMAAGFEKVFEIGPVFRANPSHTIRHDTEFTSVDVEVSWVQSHHDVMALEERWLTYVLERVRDQHGEEISATFNTEVTVPSVPFPRVTMSEAHQILLSMGHIVDRGEKGDLDPEGERLLHKYVKAETGHDFVFVTDYPSTVRAFYHMRQDDNPGLTKSFDLLWKGLEVTTGAQREHRYERLVAQAIEKGIDPESIAYYLDFFRYGCPPHGGYGFGLSRMMMILLGLKNVREATYVYRGVNRLTP